MPIKQSDITYLQAHAFAQLPKYRKEMQQVVELFKERKIETRREPQTTIELLGSKGKRKNVKGLERLEKHRGHEIATGKLTRYNAKRTATNKYHISGTVHTTATSSRARSGTTKYHDKSYPDSTPDAMIITAKSKQEAIQTFKKEMAQRHSRNVATNDDDPFIDDDAPTVSGRTFGGTIKRTRGSDEFIEQKVNSVDVDSVFIDDDIHSHSEANMMMKSVYPVRYQFIPSDDEYLDNTGECVVDQIDKIYGGLSKKISRDNFIKQCYEIENGMDKSLLDQDVENNWKLEDGVRTSTLNAILKKHNIS